MPTEVIREHKVDRSGWPRGEWDAEPDRIEWRHHGVPCLMVRARLGMWCGYAAVEPGHRWYQLDYDSVGADVHGGLTYADFCQADGGPICHVAQPGEPERVWWLGFDCAHVGDVVPSMLRHGRDWADSYRDEAYVRLEVEKLADQIIAARS
jgi:hypothetical protein